MYFLPLLIGILGLVFQYKNDRQNFLVTSLLFFMMSFALVVYLNEVEIFRSNMPGGPVLFATQASGAVNNRSRKASPASAKMMLPRRP